MLPSMHFWFFISLYEKIILWRDIAPRLKRGELRLINFENGITIFPYNSLNFFFYYFQRNVKIYGSSRIPAATPITVAPTGLAILEKQRRPVAQRALDTFHIEAAWKTLNVMTYVPQHFTKRGNATSGWFSTARQIWAVRRRFRVGWKRTALRTRNSNWPYHVQVLTTNRKT